MISSKRFSYDKATKTFTAEISELQGKLHMIRAYPDACDAGFEMVSERTGQVCRFVETAEVRNDGDISHWEFGGMGKIGKGLKVVIFND